jgi:hypothetical protein
MMDPAIDIRFSARAIWFVILCAFPWLLAFALSGQRWVFPALVGLCVYGVCQVRGKPTLTGSGQRDRAETSQKVVRHSDKSSAEAYAKAGKVASFSELGKEWA